MLQKLFQKFKKLFKRRETNSQSSENRQEEDYPDFHTGYGY
jgi:hypothetical protein